MPWKLVHNHPACRPGEWAVVNERAEAEGRHSIEGCHGTRAEALAQQRALYAKEPQMNSLVALIDQKTIADSGPGEITGYASVYGNVDLQDQVIERGAFDKTLGELNPARAGAKSKMPLLDWHGHSIDRIIGSVLELKSTPVGLWFKARFTNDDQGQRARQLAKDGHLTGVSIGWQPVRQSVKSIGDKLVEVIHEARVHEISLTPVPANPLAQLSSVKSLDGDDKATDPSKPYGDVPYADPGYQEDGKKRYPLDTEAHCRAAWSYINQADNAAKYSADELARIKGRIRAALKRYGVQVSESSLDLEMFMVAARTAGQLPDLAYKAAMTALLDQYHQAAGPVDEPPTADDAAPTDPESAGGTSSSPPDDPASYALRIITPPGPRDDAPDGTPPTGAPAGPLIPLEAARQDQEAARLEEEINQALRRATA